MKKIKYEINGTFVEIEVSDEFARQYEQIEADEKRVNRKETRRHQSLETLIESGFQIVDQHRAEQKWDAKSQRIGQQHDNPFQHMALLGGQHQGGT